MDDAGRLLRFVRDYRSRFAEFFWTNGKSNAQAVAAGRAGDVALFESGDKLIRNIYDAIVLRRSVLVTGPRGSGKSYCAEQAIERAEKDGVIYGHHFLQGNREIPRDYLSEDMLVIDWSKEARKPIPRLVDALVTRFPRAKREEMEALRDGRTLEGQEQWPAVTKLNGRESDTWKPNEWIVLFLDEINRFGDGFLDSLLSLTEERKIVRGGAELRVPIIVVATANPPGYDITAKKLSPPLQARISRAYRVSQPSHQTLAYLILPDQINRYSASYKQAATARREPDRAVITSSAIRRLVAGAALCLWGNPDLERKGIGFLTAPTRRLLERAQGASESLRDDMSALGKLVTFGPDARSVGDWIGCAMGIARRAGESEVKVEHLLPCVLESLGHKVRENFNEGADPVKVAEKEKLLSRIVRTVLTNRKVRAVFDIDFDGAIKRLTGVGVDEWLVAAPRDAAEEVKKAAETRHALFFWMLDELAFTERRTFVDALANDNLGADVLDPETVSVSEVCLIQQLIQRARKDGFAEVATRADALLGKLAQKVDASSHLPHALEFFPALAPWKTALAELCGRPSAPKHRDALATWFVATAVALDALDEAPQATSSWFRRVSPAAADLVVRAKISRKDVSPIASPSELMQGAMARRIDELLPAGDHEIERLLVDTAERLRAEVAFGLESHVDAGFNFVRTHLKARSQRNDVTPAPS